MNNIPAFYFEPDPLKKLSDSLRDDFKNAVPFPHVVIGGLVPDEILDMVAQEFPALDQIEWTFWGPGMDKNKGDKKSNKIGASDETKFGPFTRHFIQQLNSATFIRFIEDLTGEKHLITDPTYNGCGLHSTGRGGKLMIHTDVNRHPCPTRIHQRFNLIFFLNKDWKEEYGGHLELWDKKGKNCIKKILPVFNRCVLFDTSRTSFHGHPHPLTCPEGMRRNSIAVYYYCVDRPDDVSYKGLQRRVNWVPQTAEEKAEARRQKVVGWAHDVIPPICVRAAKKLKRMLKN